MLLAGSGLTVRSSAESAISWYGMRVGHVTAVSNMYQANKRNILLLWEGTNSIRNEGKTAAQAITDARDYVTAIRAAHPDWEIYVITAIPRRETGAWTILELNQKIDEYNSTLKTNYKAYGFNGVIDVRDTGSPFNISNYTTGFAEMEDYWTTGEKTADAVSVHLNSLGYSHIARYVTQKLRSIGVR